MLNRLKSTLIDFIQQADLVLLGLCVVSTLYGIVLVFSATRYLPASTGMRRMIIQTAALGLGICVYIFFSMLDLELLMKKWKWMLAFNIGFICLLLTPFGIGAEETGNNAWLKFPGIPFQIGPAEVVKITFVLLLAKQMEWLWEEKRDMKSFRSAFFVAGHTLALCGLYFVVSGDMGNALVFLFIFLCMAFVAGFALRWFALFFSAFGGVFALAWELDLIYPYMKNRFIVLFDHTYDPQGASWQQSRSLLAIGSGGPFGQGYLNGPQSQSTGGLPARQTDLIFAVAGEELGLIGCAAVMLLLALIIFRILLVARRAQTPFYRYVCVGMASILIFQTIINIGMCLFVMPTIGITLPFFSYGGSSIVTLYMSMGVVSGIKKRSPEMRRVARSPLR